MKPAKIRHFAAEALVLDAAELKDVTTPKRYTLLLCLIHRAQIQARDDLAEMFLKRIARFHVHAQQELELIRARHRALTEELIDTLADMLRVVEANPSDAELGRQGKSTVAQHGDLAELLAGCDAIAAYSDDNHLPLLWRFYRSHRAVLFRLARTIAFDATTTDRALLKALQALLAQEDANADWLPANIEGDVSFASEQWQRTVFARVDRRRRIARRHFEVCIFSSLATGLKSGDIAVRGSDAYADYREQLLPWSDCEPAIADYCRQLSIPSDAYELVAVLRAWLAETAQRVDTGFLATPTWPSTSAVNRCSNAGRGLLHPHRPKPWRQRCLIQCLSAACWTYWPTSTSGPSGCATSGHCPGPSQSGRSCGVRFRRREPATTRADSDRLRAGRLGEHPRKRHCRRTARRSRRRARTQPAVRLWLIQRSATS